MYLFIVHLTVSRYYYLAFLTLFLAFVDEIRVEFDKIRLLQSYRLVKLFTKSGDNVSHTANFILKPIKSSRSTIVIMITARAIKYAI